MRVGGGQTFTRREREEKIKQTPANYSVGSLQHQRWLSMISGGTSREDQGLKALGLDKYCRGQVDVLVQHKL